MAILCALKLMPLSCLSALSLTPPSQSPSSAFLPAASLAASIPSAHAIRALVCSFSFSSHLHTNSPRVTFPMQSIRLLYPVTSSTSPLHAPWKPLTLNFPDHVHFVFRQPTLLPHLYPPPLPGTISTTGPTSPSIVLKQKSGSHLPIPVSQWSSSLVTCPFVNVSQTCPFLSAYCRHLEQLW